MLDQVLDKMRFVIKRLQTECEADFSAEAAQPRLLIERPEAETVAHITGNCLRCPTDDLPAEAAPSR